VAHDLRNPLSALHSNVGFLEASPDAPAEEQAEVLADVNASCWSLGHIVENLELLGMITSGRIPRLDRGPLVLKDLVSDTVTRASPTASSYGARIVLGTLDPSDVRVLGHRDMLGRALLNLVINAAQHGRRTGPVMLEISTAGESGVVRITDQGAPLPAELREAAFTAEGQLRCKTDPNGRYGRGLGLYSAALAAGVSGASVRAGETEDGLSLLELRAPLA
jgi:signal transduction histidine kinase